MRTHILWVTMVVLAATSALAQDDEDPYHDHYTEGLNQGESGGACAGSESYYYGCMEGQDDEEWWDQYETRQKEKERERQEQFQRDLDREQQQSDCDLLPVHVRPNEWNRPELASAPRCARW